VNETAGTFTSVTDFSLVGTAFCGSGQAKTGFTRATRTLAYSQGLAGETIDFSSVLLFPSAPIVSASIVSYGSLSTASIINISAAQVFVSSDAGSIKLEVTADQSGYSTTSKQG
jgi:hypothetical protein